MTGGGCGGQDSACAATWMARGGSLRERQSLVSVPQPLLLTPTGGFSALGCTFDLGWIHRSFQ